MSQFRTTTQSLHAADGARKYLTPDERQRFMALAWTWPRRDVGLLCLLVCHSGCRISEALALTGASLDRGMGMVTIRSLKKRRAFVHRHVPLPDSVIVAITQLHGDRSPQQRIWPWSRTRAWEIIKSIMREAGISDGPHQTAKGLRHGFGVNALQCGVPLHLLQRWLGHARLSTTAIYADVLGPEERFFAERMWNGPIDRVNAATPIPDQNVSHSVT
jgi:integrase/recombinase XerD